MSSAPDPALRASDRDREETTDRLRHAAGEGRLTVEELGDRLEAALAARTCGELAGLVADVVVVPESSAADVRTTGRRLAVRPGGGGARWIVAVLGGSDREGHWRLGERCVAVNVMGGSHLDLREAELAAQDSTLTVFSLMGGGEVQLPESLNVEVSELAVLGGNEIRIGSRTPDPGGPTLRVRLVSVMGGSEVYRGLSSRERRHERRLARRERRLGERRGG